MKILEKIFSVKNDDRGTHKIITVAGVKLKLKQKNTKQKSVIKPQLPKIKYMETHLCDHCNLNCKRCGHFCNLINEEIFTDLEQYKKDIVELSKKIQIGQIRLMGGEPLLHPQVNEFVIATRQAFPKSDIRIVTNGILLPAMKEDFWETCRANRVKIDLSKYPIVGNKFSEYLDLLDDNNVALGYIHLAKKFHSKRNENGDSDIVEAFKACSSKNCVTLWKQKIWVCPACYREYSNKIYNENRDLPDGLNIYEATSEEMMKVLNHPCEACRWCSITSTMYPWEKDEKRESVKV